MVRILSIHFDGNALTLDAKHPLASKETYHSASYTDAALFADFHYNGYVELKEGIFQLNSNFDPIKVPDPFDVILDSALAFGKSRYPKGSICHHAAFANSVTYLMTGKSGGYGGPSCREHAVSWAISGDANKTALVAEGLSNFKSQFSMAEIPPAGKWEYEKASIFAFPLCYGMLDKIHYECYKNESCFDDAQQDIERLKKSIGILENR